MHALVPHLAVAVPLQHERSTLLVSSDDVSSRTLTPFAFADGSIYANIRRSSSRRRAASGGYSTAQPSGCTFWASDSTTRA